MQPLHSAPFLAELRVGEEREHLYVNRMPSASLAQLLELLSCNAKFMGSSYMLAGAFRCGHAQPNRQLIITLIKDS